MPVLYPNSDHQISHIAKCPVGDRVNPNSEPWFGSAFSLRHHLALPVALSWVALLMKLFSSLWPSPISAISSLSFVCVLSSLTFHHHLIWPKVPGEKVKVPACAGRQEEHECNLRKILFGHWALGRAIHFSQSSNSNADAFQILHHRNTQKYFETVRLTHIISHHTDQVLDWRCGLCSTAPAVQLQSPESNPNTTQKSEKKDSWAKF
jgi:hypothetical protein